MNKKLRHLYEELTELLSIVPYIDTDTGDENELYSEIKNLWDLLDDAVGDPKCPLGGDETNDCADCVDACDYHFVNGECVRREDE